MLQSLPNLLSLTRILIIPLFIGTFWLPPGWAHWIAMGLFTFAGITDFFDGYLARKLGSMSKLGQFMDPVADKLIVAAALLMMAFFDRLEGLTILAAVIILCREVLVSGLREFLADVKVSVPVTALAKWKTTVQMLAIGFLLVGREAPDWIPALLIGDIGLWIAAILTLYTGYDYLRAGLRHIAAVDRGEL